MEAQNNNAKRDEYDFELYLWALQQNALHALAKQFEAHAV